MVIAVEKFGLNPTVRSFHTCRNTVRKWYRRWLALGDQGLEELSRQPHPSPRRTPLLIQDELVRLKKKYKRVGAETVKTIENLPYSAKTIRKYWRNSRKRRKKYITKQTLRAVKK